MARKEFVVEDVKRIMDNIEQVRNVAIVAHVDHGKTTLTDSLVARAGLISKELAGEQRIMDFDEQEQARGITIKAANISLGFSFEGKDYVINLIDTPGHVDFGGHVTRAMRAVDGVVLVVDSVEGIMPQTETVLRQALKERARPVLFINKIDRLINELKLSREEMIARLTKIITNVNKIISTTADEEFRDKWQVSVEKGSVAIGSAYNKWALSITSMKKFNISMKDIYDLCAQNRHKELQEKTPLDEVLLEMIIKHHPNPKEAQKYRIPRLWKGDLESEAGKSMMNCDRNSKTIGVVFGVVYDEHAGEVAVVRLFSGTVQKGDELYLAAKFKSEKIQQVSIYMGPDRVIVDKVSAGNIVGIIGLKDVFVGETVSSVALETPFESIKHYSEPVITKSIEAKDSKDLAKLIEVLRQLSKEDPTLKVELNHETGEHLISGMGELHLEIIEYKIVNERGIQIKTSPPLVVYRETIKGQSKQYEGKSPNKHNKFYISVEPMQDTLYNAIIEGKIPEGRPKGKAIVEDLVKAGMNRDDAKGVINIKNACVLIDNTRGVQYLNEVMELVHQAFEEAVSSGPMCKEKMIRTVIRLHDALLHEDAVHRGPAQIIPAVKRPIYAGFLSSDPTLLEPKQKFLIQVPQEYMNNIIQLISGRRGQLLDTTMEGELATITAKLPVAETFGFSNDIRGASQGRAIWYQEYAGFEELPKNLVLETVKKIRKRKGEKEEMPKPEDFVD
ncbi:MAG: elongation factor EF-2 [Candidatus Micrarchaeota archaeon]|nr:elongation factor EF-2 [Candidatus Micrarchaeota archaeon]